MTPNALTDFSTEPIKAGRSGDPQAANAHFVAVARVLPKYLRNSGSGALLSQYRDGDMYRAPLLFPVPIAVARLTCQALA